MKRIIKKIDYCSNCGFLDTNSYCRKGLGWKYIKNPKTSYCSDQRPIRPRRCGTCYWFTINEQEAIPTDRSRCKKWDYFTNFYNCCAFYEHEKGKNIRPKADEIPLKLKEIWQQ